jgi:hypothetical protein
MSGRVICHGCGQWVPLPEGYRRNKIQCPACGVICEVTEAARAAAASTPPAAPAPAPKRREPSPRDEDERWAADFFAAADEPSDRPVPVEEEQQPPSDEEPEYDGRPPPRQVSHAPMKFPCRRCRRLIERQGECPYCAEEEAEAGAPRLTIDEPQPAEDDEDDGQPYILDGGNDVSCPKCTKQLPPNSTFCTRCGYDFRRRKKVRKTFQPLARAWETNYSLAVRKTIFFWLQVFGISVGLWWNLTYNGDWFAFAGSTVLFAAMTAFLLGTFDRIELRRDEKGRVTLTKLRRYCFFLAPEKRIEVRGFEGVITGRSSEVSAVEWIVCIILLLMIVPGIVYWYYVIHKISFRVSLAQDHGREVELVYHGWREEQMRDIQLTLCGASGLRHLA